MNEQGRSWEQMGAASRPLALSDYFTPMTQGNLPTPGYGGLMYDLQQDGGIVAMQVQPAS